MATGKYQKWLEPDGLLLLEGWARNGLTEAQIAHNCGINAKTLWDWKRRFDPIGNALKKGKDVVDIEVENALLKRALGYDVVESFTEDSDVNGHKVRTTVRHVPGDVTAQIFWLKNRRPKDWRERREAEAADKPNELLQSLLDLERRAQP